jgi:hypothetical protein
MLTLRITKQFDCKGKWYQLTLEDKGRIIKEHEVDCQQVKFDKGDVKSIIKKHIRILVEKYNGWIVIKDESRGHWKYLEHLVPISDNGEVSTPRKKTKKLIEEYA